MLHACMYVVFYNAGVVVVNLKVIGLALGQIRVPGL
jgi:hypothetical protein